MYHNKAILVFTRPLQFFKESRNEPFSPVSWNDIEFLFSAIFTDFIENLISVAGTDVLVYSHDSESTKEVLSQLGGHIVLQHQQGHTFEESVYVGVENAFQENYHRILVLLETNPLVEAEMVYRAFTQLGIEDDCMLYGPLDDGNCYIVGMNANHSDIFQPSPDGSRSEHFSFLRQLCQRDVLLILLSKLYPMNSGQALLRLKKDLENKLGSTTKAARRTLEMFRILQKKYNLNQLK